MGREHVVVGGDDAQIAGLLGADLNFLRAGQRGPRMGQIGATESLARGRVAQRFGDRGEIVAPALTAAFNDAVGNRGKGRVHGRRVDSVRRIGNAGPAQQRPGLARKFHPSKAAEASQYYVQVTCCAPRLYKIGLSSLSH